MRGKIFSIFPVFILINIAIFAGSYLIPSSLERPFTLSDLLLSSTGLSQYMGVRYLSTAMWFVPFILQVYCLFPVIEWLLERMNAALLQLLAFALSLLLIAVVFHEVPEQALEICRNWSPLFRLPEVVIGFVLARWVTKKSTGREALTAVAAYAFSCAAMAI